MINEFDVWQAGIIDAEIHPYPPRIGNKVQAAHEIGDNVAGLRRGSEDLRGRVLEFYCRERKFAGVSFRRLVPPQLTSPKIHKIQPGALRGGWGRGSPTPGECSARPQPSAEGGPAPLAEVPHQSGMLARNSWCGTSHRSRVGSILLRGT